MPDNDAPKDEQADLSDAFVRGERAAYQLIASVCHDALGWQTDAAKVAALESERADAMNQIVDFWQEFSAGGEPPADLHMGGALRDVFKFVRYQFEGRDIKE